MSSNNNYKEGDYKKVVTDDSFFGAMKKSFDSERMKVTAGGESSTAPLSKDSSELPESFADAVKRAAKLSVNCIQSGKNKVRIDFDTSIGDQTYTSLKSTIPMVSALTQSLAGLLSLSSSSEIVSEEDQQPLKTMRIFFPDMGAAALARRDWKLG